MAYGMDAEAEVKADDTVGTLHDLDGSVSIADAKSLVNDLKEIVRRLEAEKELRARKMASAAEDEEKTATDVSAEATDKVRRMRRVSTAHATGTLGPASLLASRYDIGGLGTGVEKKPEDRIRQMTKWQLEALDIYMQIMGARGTPLPGAVDMGSGELDLDAGELKDLEREAQLLREEVETLKGDLEIQHSRSNSIGSTGLPKRFHLMNNDKLEGTSGSVARMMSGVLVPQVSALDELSRKSGAVFVVRDVAPQARVLHVAEVVGNDQAERRAPVKEGQIQLGASGKRMKLKDKTDKQSLLAAQLTMTLQEVVDKGYRVFDPTKRVFLKGMFNTEGVWVPFEQTPRDENFQADGKEVIVISESIASETMNRFIDKGYSRTPVMAEDYPGTLLIEAPNGANIWRVVPHQKALRDGSRMSIASSSSEGAPVVLGASGGREVAPGFWGEEFVARFGEWNPDQKWDMLTLTVGHKRLGQDKGEHTFVVGDYAPEARLVRRMVADVDAFAAYPQRDDDEVFEGVHQRVDLSARFPESGVEGYGMPACGELFAKLNKTTQATMGRGMIEHGDDVHTPVKPAPPENLLFVGPGNELYFAQTREAVAKALRYLAETRRLHIYAHREWANWGEDFKAVYDMRTRVVDRTGCAAYFEDTATTIDEQIQVATILAGRGEQHGIRLIEWCEAECAQLRQYIDAHVAKLSAEEKETKLAEGEVSKLAQFSAGALVALNGQLADFEARLSEARHQLEQDGCCGLWKKWHAVSTRIGCAGACPPEAEPLSEAGLALLGERKPSVTRDALMAAGVQVVDPAVGGGLKKVAPAPLVTVTADVIAEADVASPGATAAAPA